MVIISFFNILGKINLTISIFATILDTNVVNILIIYIYIYHSNCKLKKAQVFDILIKNL